MKKIVIDLLLTSFIAAGLTACWSEDIPEAGAARRQVTDLTATPGDEEVQLAWSLPEGWNPTSSSTTPMPIRKRSPCARTAR